MWKLSCSTSRHCNQCVITLFTSASIYTVFISTLNFKTDTHSTVFNSTWQWCKEAKRRQYIKMFFELTFDRHTAGLWLCFICGAGCVLGRKWETDDEYLVELLYLWLHKALTQKAFHQSDVSEEEHSSYNRHLPYGIICKCLCVQFVITNSKHT